MIDFTFYDEKMLSPQPESFYSDLIEHSIKVLGLDKLDLGLSLQIVDEAKMRHLNSTYRAKDKPTDVLSFPVIDGIVDSHTTSRDILEIGDLYICISVAIEKAKEAGKTLDDELRFLVVHGFLHLLGYDHEKSANDEKIMFSLQDKILSSI